MLFRGRGDVDIADGIVGGTEICMFTAPAGNWGVVRSLSLTIEFASKLAGNYRGLRGRAPRERVADKTTANVVSEDLGAQGEPSPSSIPYCTLSHFLISFPKILRLR